MKTIKTQNYPTLIFSTETSAQEKADKHGIEVCRIIMISEWNGETEEKFIGFGLMDNDELLGTEDFTWI